MVTSLRNRLVRRSVLKGLSGLSAGLLLARTGEQARAAEREAASMTPPPDVTTQPPRQWGPNAPPSYAPDPDVVVIDRSFRDLVSGNATIHRVWDQGAWIEGPAWSAEGRYLLFSDTVTSRQYRYLWETGEVTLFRPESYHTNGSTFDYLGRQISCEHFLRRVVRWEHDGSVHVVADHFENKPLSSPNDVIAHPDGSIWFTDPGYGDSVTEGHADAAGGEANPDGRIRWRVGEELIGAVGGCHNSPAPPSRLDPPGRLYVGLPRGQHPTPTG